MRGRLVRSLHAQSLLGGPSSVVQQQTFIHGAEYPHCMIHGERNTVTETPSLSHPWVKKVFADWFLHRQPQDGDSLSGPTLSGHAQLRAQRDALRCQDLVGELKLGPTS